MNNQTEHSIRLKAGLSYAFFDWLYRETEVARKQTSNTLADWYALSEDVFKAQALESPDDLLKFIAFAYSWMPTIPTLHFDETNALKSFIPALKDLRAKKLIDREQLVTRLTKAVNNSVVGVSKILHFIAPQVPIIDSRVMTAWRNLFQAIPEMVSFPKYHINDLERRVEKYLRYWDQMDEWLAACHNVKPELKMRDLESALYWYGVKE